MPVLELNEADLTQLADDTQPLGELPTTMLAWVIREDRLGEPEDAIKLPDAGRTARLIQRFDVREFLQSAGFCKCLETRRRFLGDRLHQRVPCGAVRTLSLPLQGLAAAFGTAIYRLRPGHQLSLPARSSTGTRRASAHNNS